MPFSCGFVLLLTAKSAAVHSHFSSVWLEIRVNFLSDNRWIVGSFYLLTFGRDFARNTIALTLLAGLLGRCQLCLALYNPVDCSPPGSSVRGDSPGKNTGVGCYALLQGVFPMQELNLVSLMSPALAGRFFSTGTIWEALERHFRS